jgi:hypothetical protein
LVGTEEPPGMRVAQVLRTIQIVWDVAMLLGREGVQEK